MMSKRRFSLARVARPLRQNRQVHEKTPARISHMRHSPQSLVREGKHIGRTFVEVCKMDRLYIEWALRKGRSSDLSPNLAALVEFVRQTYGGLMTLGKHQGRYFTEVLEQDPSYAEWCRSISCEGEALRDFAKYSARAIAQQQASFEKEGKSGFSGKCIFCLEKQVSAAWVPCGHTVACHDCAAGMPQRCPICRQHALVQKLFVG